MTRDGTPEALAPSIEAGWRQAFVVELRLQGASGSAVADALVEVETHCAESGERAVDAFGPAAQYARALALPDETNWTPLQLARTWVRLLLFVGGFWLATWGGAALFLGDRAELSLDWLVSAAVTLIAMVLVFSFGNRLMRFILDHVVWATMGFIVVLALVVVSGLPFRNILLGTAPAVVPFMIGVAAIVAGIVYTLFLRKTGTSLDDPLVPPHVATDAGN